MLDLYEESIGCSPQSTKPQVAVILSFEQTGPFRAGEAQDQWPGHSIWDDVFAVGPAGDEVAVLGRVMPDFAPAVANRLLLLPCRLACYVEQVYAAGASPGHLQNSAIRIGGLFLRCTRWIFAYVERVAERHVGYLPSREYGRMRLAGEGQSCRSNDNSRDDASLDIHYFSSQATFPGAVMAIHPNS